MKMSNKVLVVFLILNALMPIAFTLMGLADPSSLLGSFGISPNSESIATAALLPSFTIVVAAWTIVAINWLLQGRREGWTMAILLGGLCVAAGVLNAFAFSRLGRNPLVDAPDVVRGILILALCWWASPKTTAAIAMKS